MNKPADETMPEVLYALPHKGLYIASPHKTEDDDTKYVREDTTAPALDQEAVREDTQDKRAEELTIALYAEQHDMTIDDVKAEMESEDGIGDGDYFQAWKTGIEYALSAKPYADIIGKMEGLKVLVDEFPTTLLERFNTTAEKAHNAAIDQCIALVKQGAKVGE